MGQMRTDQRDRERRSHLEPPVGLALSSEFSFYRLRWSALAGRPRIAMTWTRESVERSSMLLNDNFATGFSAACAGQFESAPRRFDTHIDADNDIPKPVALRMVRSSIAER